MSLTLASNRQQPPVVTGSAALMPSSMTDVMRMADLMASAKMVPKHLQGSPGDCFMVVEQAMRWNMSPFAVAQATSSISGKLMFEGKLVAAAVESSGAIVGFLDHDFSGSGDSREIRMWATRRGEAEPREVTVKFAAVKTTNEMWKKQPDQQLVYSASRIWARAWTPSVILGVYSREEFEEAPRREPEHTGATIELEATRIEQPRQPTPTPRTALEKFGDRIAALPDRASCFTFLDEPTIKAAFDKRPGREQEAIRDMLAAKVDAFLTGPQGPQPDEMDDAGEPDVGDEA